MKPGKLLAMLLCIVLTAGLVACSGGGGTVNTGSTVQSEAGGQKDGEKGERKEKITLTFWGGIPETAGPQAIVEAWNAEHPDVQVEYVRYVNDDAGNLKLDTTLVTGEGADVYITHSFTRYVKRTQMGGMADLAEFGDYDFEGKLGDVVEAYKIDGKYYGVPTTNIPYLLLINKDMLDEAGLPVPELGWTWEEFREYAKKLTKDGVYGYGVNTLGNTNMNPVDSALHSVGPYKPDGSSNFDHPVMREVFEHMYEMMYVDKSTPEYGHQVATKMPIDQMFYQGKVAMFNAGSYEMRNGNNLKDYPRDFKIAFAPLPRIDDIPLENFKWPSGLNDIISINPHSKYKEEAWEFVKWYIDGGLMPVIRGGRIPLSNAIRVDDMLAKLTEGVEHTYDLDSIRKYVLKSFPTYLNQLSQQEIDIRREEYEKYFTNGQTLDEMIANMTRRANEFLKQNK